MIPLHRTDSSDRASDAVREDRRARLPDHEVSKFRVLEQRERELMAISQDLARRLQDARADRNWAKAEQRRLEEMPTRDRGGTDIAPKFAQRVARLEADVARLEAEQASATMAAGEARRLLDACIALRGVEGMFGE